MRSFSARVDADIAEFLGVLLGDGCISRFVYRGKEIFEVAFTGNLAEVGYYRDFLKPVVEGRFPVKGRLWVRDDNMVRLHFRSKRLSAHLLSLGLPLGKKKDASIPPSVIGNRLIIPFIRGFYHAEGSIYYRYSKRYSHHAKHYNNLLVIQFRCKLKTLMLQLHHAVERLGFGPTRVGEADGVYTFRLANQQQIRRFIQVVRPRYKAAPKTGASL